MSCPDFAGASNYACRRLQQDLSPGLRYHSLFHTRDDVVPAAERLAQWEGVGGEDLLLLRTAAWYHDIGFVQQRDEHETISVQIAREILPDFGYSAAQINLISGMILATRLPQSPHTLLEQIMADADLDTLGRADFFCRSLDLRTELSTADNPLSLGAWYQRQIQFLQQHRYFTPAARRLRDRGKQFNLRALRLLLAAL